MTRHFSFLLLLGTLITAACQPSAGAIQTSAAQTQAVQSAFESAVAAAQTQAAPPTARPSPTLEPTLAVAEPTSIPNSPVPTLRPGLQMTVYLDLLLQKFAKSASAAVDANVVSVDYLHDSSDAVIHMDVGTTKRAGTQKEYVYAGVLFSLRALCGTLLPDGSAAFPGTLQTYKIIVYDESLAKVGAVSGNWADLVAWKNRSLTDDEFAARLLYE